MDVVVVVVVDVVVDLLVDVVVVVDGDGDGDDPDRRTTVDGQLGRAGTSLPKNICVGAVAGSAFERRCPLSLGASMGQVGGGSVDTRLSRSSFVVRLSG